MGRPFPGGSKTVRLAGHGASTDRGVTENGSQGRRVTLAVRVGTVPMHDRIDTGTLRSIADQSGGENFQAWCQWIDRNH